MRVQNVLLVHFNLISKGVDKLIKKFTYISIV